MFSGFTRAAAGLPGGFLAETLAQAPRTGPRKRASCCARTAQRQDLAHAGGRAACARFHLNTMQKQRTVKQRRPKRYALPGRPKKNDERVVLRSLRVRCTLLDVPLVKLAELLGERGFSVSTSTVQAWQRLTPVPREFAAAIAAVLECTVEDLEREPKLR